MKDDAKSLRAELDRIGTRRGRCIRPELRDRATAWIAARRAAGRKVSELAAELGVSDGTILRWSSRGVKAIVPVRVVPDATGDGVSVVSPSGFRIEGLSLTDAVRALRELG